MFEIGFSGELGENRGFFGNAGVKDEVWIGNHLMGLHGRNSTLMAWNRMAEWDMGMELEGIRGKLALETELLLLLIGNSLNRNRIDFRETELSLCPSLTHWINSRAWGYGLLEGVGSIGMAP